MTNWHGVTPRAWQVEALPKALASQRGVIRAATGAGSWIGLVQGDQCSAGGV